MSSTQSGLTARRKLSFVEQPYREKTFYLDIKASSLKSRICERIRELGGQVECFLSRDVTLLITDNTTKTGAGKDGAKGSALTAIQNNQQHIPLSRGQALLQKASKQHKSDHGSNQDLASVARGLGVKTEMAATFLRSSTKHLAKAKSHGKGPGKANDPMLGMSPISWDKEKETLCVLKVEDSEQLYRPLFKQFENIPKICYSETGSPFDVGAVLVKPSCTEHNQKKYAGGALRGGYCESCDHWYKTTLREHLNSDKHREFVSKIENFKSLETVATSLPRIGEFLVKHGRDPSFAIPNQGLIANKENDTNNNLINTHELSNGIHPTTLTAGIASNTGCDQMEQMEVDGVTTGASEASLTAKSDLIGNPRKTLLQKYRSRHTSGMDCLSHKPAATCDIEMMSPHVGALQTHHVSKTNQSTPLNMNQVSNPTSNVRQKLKYITIHDKASTMITQPNKEQSVTEILKCKEINSAADDNTVEQPLIKSADIKLSSDRTVGAPIENMPHVSLQNSDTNSSRTCDFTPEDGNKLQGCTISPICDKPANMHNWLDIDQTAQPKDNVSKIGSNLYGLGPELCFSSSGSSCSFGDKGVANVISFLQNDTSSHSSVGNANSNRVDASADNVNQRNAEAMLCSTDSITETTVNFFDNFKQSTKANMFEEMDLKIGSSSGVSRISLDDLQPDHIEHTAVLSTKQNVSPRDDKSDTDNSKVTTVSCSTHSNNISDNSVSDIPLLSNKALDHNSENGECAIKDSLDTPVKPSLVTNYPSNVFNSGSTCSTVRNWLLPPDNDCLDNTLTAGEAGDNKILSQNHVGIYPAHAAIPQQHSTHFVSDWIEQQPFCSVEKAEKENTKHDSIQPPVNTVQDHSPPGSNIDDGRCSNRGTEANKTHLDYMNLPTAEENVLDVKDRDTQQQVDRESSTTAIDSLAVTEMNIMSTTAAVPNVIDGTDDFWISSSSGISDCIVDYPPILNEMETTFNNKLPTSQGTGQLIVGQSGNSLAVTNMQSSEGTVAAEIVTNPFSFGVNSMQDMNSTDISCNTFNIDTLLHNEVDDASSISGHNKQAKTSSQSNKMLDNNDNKLMDSQIHNTCSSETVMFGGSQRSSTPMTSETVPYHTNPSSFKMNDLSHSESNSATACDNSIVGSDANSSKSKPSKVKKTPKVKKTISKSRKAVPSVGKQLGPVSSVEPPAQSSASPRTGAISPLCHSVVMQQTQLYSPISQASDNYPPHIQQPHISDSPSKHVQTANTQAFAFRSDSNVPQHGVGNSWANVNTGIYPNNHGQYASYGNQPFQQYSSTQFQSSHNHAYGQMEQNYFNTGILPINNPYNQYYDSPGQMLTHELLQSTGTANYSPHSEFTTQNVYGQSHTQAFSNFMSSHDITSNPTPGQYTPHTRAASPSAPVGQLQYSSSADVIPCVNQPVPSFLSPTSNFVLQSQSPSQPGSQTGQEPVQAVYSNWFPSSPAYHHSRSSKSLQTIHHADIAEDLSISCNTSNNMKRNIKKPIRKTKKSAKTGDQYATNSSANSFVTEHNSLFHQGNHSSSLGTFDAYSYIRVPSPCSSQMAGHSTTTGSSGSLQHQVTNNVAAESSFPLQAGAQTQQTQNRNYLQQTINSQSTQQTSFTGKLQQTQYVHNKQQTYIQNQQPTPFIHNTQQMPHIEYQQHQQTPTVSAGLESSQMKPVAYTCTDLSDSLSNTNSAINKEAINDKNSAMHDTAVSPANHYTYHSAKMGDTKIKLCKVPMLSTSSKEASFQQQGDLKSFWNVRKAGDCRLVFSTNKRKAEDDCPAMPDPRHHIDTYTYNAGNDPYSGSSLSSGVEGYQPQVKRQRCFVY